MPSPEELADDALRFQSSFRVSVFQHFSLSERTSTIQRLYALLRCLFFEGINGDRWAKSLQDTDNTSGAFIESCRSRPAKGAVETQNEPFTG